MYPYPADYCQTLQEGALRSAGEIVPLVLALVRPTSVVDVGCGNGAWLSVFMEQGVGDALGIDADWIDPNSLLIPRERFLSADLERPLTLDRRFDLVVSLEVAEHLSAASAEVFVDTLVGLGPVILFSAAVPYQGGTNHFNEQWPEYWSRLFSSKSYVMVDCVRAKIWWNERVEWWYAQNCLLFVRSDHLESDPQLRAEHAAPSPLAIVHPRAAIERAAALTEAQRREAELLERIEREEAEAEELRRRAAVLGEQVDALRLQVSTLRDDIADLEALKPGRLPLMDVLRALPALFVHAFTTRR
jgi:SAM-dependent methyltransferase